MTTALTDQIADLQRAMQAVLEAQDLEPEAKGVAARVLLSQARQHPWDEGAVRALQWTVERDLDGLAETADGYGSAAEQRVLEMHRRGEHVCRRCQLPLPSEGTIRSWQRGRILAAIERDWLRRRDRGTAA
jgi:hypothetical protein